MSATLVGVTAVLLLATSGSLSPALAATANSIDICNKGNTTIAVARVKDSSVGLLGRRGELFNSQYGEGWWRIAPGKCGRVFLENEWHSRLAWFAFAYTDQQGTFGLANVRPTRGAGWRSSNEEFCAKVGEGYKYKVDSRTQASSCRGVNEPRDPTGYVRIPFTLEFYPDRVPDNAAGELMAYTFNVSLDVNTPVWFPLPRDSDRPSGEGTTALPPAAPLVLEQIPRPLQPGTATATLLGKAVVRWRQGGDRQWFYADGTAAEGMKGAAEEYVGLFDWPAAVSTLPETVDGFVKALQQSPVRQLRVDRDGRLYEESTDGGVWTTASVQSLDASRARYSTGLLNIPCREGYQPCVYDHLGRLSNTFRLYIGLNKPREFHTALDGLLGLKRVFGEPARAGGEDAACDCVRYDIGGSAPAPDGASPGPDAGLLGAMAIIAAASAEGRAEPSGKEPGQRVGEIEGRGQRRQGTITAASVVLMALAFGTWWARKIRSNRGKSMSGGTS